MDKLDKRNKKKASGKMPNASQIIFGGRLFPFLGSCHGGWYWRFYYFTLQGQVHCAVFGVAWHGYGLVKWPHYASVEGSTYRACCAWHDWLFGPNWRGAAARGRYSSQNQRLFARVGKLKNLGNGLALRDFAKININRFKLDGGLLGVAGNAEH